MDKVNLITLVVRKKKNGIYEHHMMPGDARITCASAASSGYISGVLHVVRGIESFAPIVLATITPWDDKVGTYEVCVIAFSSTVALLGPEFETFMLKNAFWCKKWPGSYEFSKIIEESEISSVLESLESIKEQ